MGDRMLQQFDNDYRTSLEAFLSRKDKSLSNYKEDIDNGMFDGTFNNWAARNDPMFLSVLQRFRGSAAQYQQAIGRFKGPAGKGEQDKIQRTVEESTEGVA